MKVRKTDLAWAAGIIEGEGSAMIRGMLDNRKGKRYPNPLIQISNSDVALVAEMKRLFGGVSYRINVGGTTSGGVLHRVDVFGWQVHCRKALNCAQKMLPYVKGNKYGKLLAIVNYYRQKDEGGYVH